MDSSRFCLIQEGISSVYTKTGHVAGTVIERCRTITFNNTPALDATLSQISRNARQSSSMILGFGFTALYRGGNEPNIEMVSTGPDFLEIRATRDIEPNSELQHQCTTYNTILPPKMDELYNVSEKLNIRNCPFGYGVFAQKNIREDDLIESSPLLPVNPHAVVSSIFQDYIFDTPSGCGLALGFGSLFNHQDNPNAYWMYNSETHTIDFYAKQDIRIGQEIFPRF